MAKYEATLVGYFDDWLRIIEKGIINGSATANLEDASDFYSSDGVTRCSVRVFERYSAIGSNRVSLSVTLFQDPSGAIHCSAITSGGSQAMIFKLNTFGEQSFLDSFIDVIERG